MLALLCSAIAWAHAAAGEITVRVVDAARQPVAGAWVTVVGEPRGDSKLDLEMLHAWVEAGGQGPPAAGLPWVASDADGRARLREPEFWNDFVAVTPTHGGHVIAARGTIPGAADGTGERTLDIALRPHRFWRVQVVDPADLQAKPRVPVMFGLRARMPTGDANVATFGPIDLAIDSLEVDPVLVATLRMPCLVRPRLRVRANEIGVDAMPLHLPPHGAYEVHVVNEAGEPNLDPASVEIAHEVSRIRQQGLGSSGWWHQYLEPVNGIARVDPVGLGLAMRIEVQEPDDAGGSGMTAKLLDERSISASLTRAGEVRVVTVVAPPSGHRTFRVHGRAVDPEGIALPRRKLGIAVVERNTGKELGRLVHEADRSTWVGQADTAADGSFAARLWITGQPSARGQLLIEDYGAIDAPARRTVAAATFEISELGKWDGGGLGDVALLPLPVIVAGRAVDGRGDPIEGLRVSVECDRNSRMADPAIPAWWARQWSIDVGSRADGTFELRGHVGKQAWTLQSGGMEFDTVKEPSFTPGTRGVTIVRERAARRIDGVEAGAIAGRLLLDADVPFSRLAIKLVPPGTKGEVAYDPKRRDPRARSWSLSSSVSGPPGDRFGKEAVPTGTWDLRVTLGDLGLPVTELARIDGLEVRNGETLVVPPIELRGRIRVARVRFIDGDGRPVPEGHVLCRERPRRPRKPGESPDNELFRDGEYVACTLDDWPPFEFIGHGYRRITHRFEEPGDHTLVLPPALVVQVRLPADVPLPPAPLTLDVELRTKEVLTELFMYVGAPPHSASFDETRLVELHLPAAALYSLNVHVSRRTSNSWRGSPVLDDLPIDLADTDEPRVIDLGITAEMIEQAVQKLGF